MCATSPDQEASARVAAPASPFFGGSQPARLLVLGLWAGVTYGDAEGLEVLVLSLIPGALSWRSANSANALWFAPVFYGTVFLLLALPVAALAKRIRRIPWDGALVFLYVFLGGFSGFTLREGFLADVAAAILALGIATELTRQYRRRPEVFQRFFRRSLPAFAAVPVLAALVLLGGGWLAERQRLAHAGVATAERPNLLLLVMDAQRADHLSSYGYVRPTSPRLDAFARDGERFLNAYASSSWTLPSHASLFTGRELHEHGAGLMRRPYLDDHFPTLAEALTRAGYATGGFCGNTFWAGRQTGLDRGFIHYEDFYRTPGDAIIRTSLGRRLALQVLPGLGLLADIPGRRSAADLNAALLGWIDGLGGKRFFAFVNYLDAHGPNRPPAPYGGRFSPPSDDGNGIEFGAITSDIVVPPPARLHQMVEQYDESVLYLDAQLGRLFDALRARGLLNGTVVVVTSDHGESWGEHALMYHGHSLYREQLHVPLIVRYPPRVPAGKVEARPVGIVNLAATLADLAQLPPASFPGRSLLEAPLAGAPPPVIAELGQRSLMPLNWPSSRGWQATLITDRWQLIRSPGDTLALFDLQEDSAQARNRAGDPGLASTVATLQRVLDDLAPPGRLDWYGWKH